MDNTNRPLEGVTVIELATFIAGPSCTRLLADLGAEVVKIEGFKGDPIRGTATNEGRPEGDLENTSFDLENANKKGIALNLKSEEGKEIFHRLLKGADVFVTNWRPQALERAGLDYDTLKVDYPALVYGLVSGYGEAGPDKDLPGFDFTAFFARGGIMGTMYDKTSLPMLPVPGFGDHQVGMNLAAGVLAALYKAEKTGKGDKVTVSLFHSAIWDVSIMLQSAQYGHPSTQYPVRRTEIPNPLQLTFRTKDDRYIQVAMPQYDHYFPIFIELLGFPELKEDPRFYPQANAQENLEELQEVLVKGMASKTLAQWKTALTEADIPFAVAQTWPEILEDRQAWENQYLYAMEYPTGATRTLVRPPVLMAEAGIPEYKRGPYLGEQTEEILAKCGYTPEQIADLLHKGVAQGR